MRSTRLLLGLLLGCSRLVVTNAVAGDVAQGIPVREYVAPNENPALDQKEADAEARMPRAEQPGVDTPIPDVDSPDDVQQPPDEEP
jgi:hypothetical protein